MLPTVPSGAALMLAALALLILADPADAAARHRRSRTVCVPAYIEGAGSMLLCPPARGR